MYDIIRLNIGVSGKTRYKVLEATLPMAMNYHRQTGKSEKYKLIGVFLRGTVINY